MPRVPTALTSSFNIVEWYHMQLEGSGIYNSLYLAETLEFIETTRIELNSVSKTLSDGLGEDLPSLESILDPSQDSESILTSNSPESLLGDLSGYQLGMTGDIFSAQIHMILTKCQPYPGDTELWLNTQHRDGRRFDISRDEYGFYEIFD